MMTARTRSAVTLGAWALMAAACGGDSRSPGDARDAGDASTADGGRTATGGTSSGGSATGGRAASTGGGGPTTGGQGMGGTGSGGGGGAMGGADGGSADGGSADGGPGASDATADAFEASDAAVDALGSADAASDVEAGPATCTGRCADPAPVDWEGPLGVKAYATTETAPACDGAFPDLAADYFGGFRPGSASCGCECQVGASACSVEVWAEASGCTPSGSRSFVISPNSCTPVSDNGRFVTAPVNELVVCADPTVTETLPTPSFSAGFRACEGPPSTTGCTPDTQCVPDDPSVDVCIVRAGTHRCPAGPYTERRVAHTDFTDTRACSACSCTGAETCEGTIEFRNGTGGCPANQIGTVAADDAQNCTATALAPTHAYFDATTFGGTCTASGGELTGNARATMPNTICCLP